MNFHEMDKRKKLQYIFDYYKLPILGVLILIYIAGYGIFRFATRTDPILYVALVNVGGSISDTGVLTDGYLATKGTDTGRMEVVLLPNLYLTSDTSSEYYTYSEASEVKILGSIDAEKLDVVIANKEAFDAFEEQGFISESNEITDSPLLKEFGFSEPVYAGIIKNTPRPDEAGAYLSYLE